MDYKHCYGLVRKVKLLKKILSLLLAALLCFFAVTAYALDSENSGRITSALTPVTSSQASLRWSKRLGKSYKNAPAPPVKVGNTLIVMSGKTLYKLNIKTGDVIGTAAMEDTPSYSYTPPTYADGVIYCPLDNATVQAFDYETMTSLWVYHDSLGGQSLTEIVYDGGFLYTGFWNDEDADANYVCLNAQDEDKSKTNEEKSAVWSYTHKGGFYWAKCAVIGSRVIFGTDDGTTDDNQKSLLISADKKSGNIKQTVEIKGDQRSGITYNGGRIYFTTKAGLLYSVGVKDGGSLIASDVKTLSLGGASTSTPVIYSGRLYVGVQGNGFGKGTLAVIDSANMKKIYSAVLNGYPQNTVLLSTAYEKASGNIYVYSTYNASPGGITVLTDSMDRLTAKTEELFVPSGDMANYCISSVIADDDGTLIYKNDSGYIFAVENTESQTQDISQIIKIIFSAIKKVISFLKDIF